MLRGTSVHFQNHCIKELKFVPLSSNAVTAQNPGQGITIIVNQITDPESAWDDIKLYFELQLGSNSSDLKSEFADAFGKLQNEARLRLVLPDPGVLKTTYSFIARLRASVSEQRKSYECALGNYETGNGTADSHLRDAMRIAYNFADDAIKVLALLVSIADLKPLLFWCTLKEHYEVAEAFRDLPWTRNPKKPSLEQYREIINGARNHAFHNLLAFDRTIEADMQGIQINARRLTLLPAFSHRKSTVAFDYEDREMIEILTELTRAPEVAVPLQFWKKNAMVMKAFEALLLSTEEALLALNQALT